MSRKAALTRDRVLRAAVTLADKKGIESLSMRKLGQALGIEAMSLYNHVANKEDVLNGIVDIVFSEIDIPSGVDWKTAMRRRAISTLEALSRHRWAAGLMESRTQPGPANLRAHDAVIGCFRKAGFSIKEAAHAYSAIDSYIIGFALQQQRLPLDNSQQVAEVGESMLRQMGENYPYLAEMIGHALKPGYDYAKEFEFGLDLILDGLEMLPTSGVVPGSVRP